MSGPSWTGTVSGLEVTVLIEGACPKLPDYPLLPGDVLVDREDGTFGKVAPGLGIEGIVLTDDQRATLKAVEDVAFGIGGLDYFLGDE